MLHLTRARAKHHAALKPLMSHPRLFRTAKVRYSRTVTLSRPLGDRAVVDAADRAYLRQRGASPGEPACRSRRLQDYLDTRRLVGLPFGIPHVRRLLRTRPDYPYTNAERRYLNRWDHLWARPPVRRSVQSHRPDIAGMDREGQFPEMPHLVVWVTRRLEFHRRHVGSRAEVRPTDLTAADVWELWERIDSDSEAAGQIMSGYGDAGFYIEDVMTHGARVVIRLRTQRTDATQWFRDRYGQDVDVIVSDQRWECTGVAFYATWGSTTVCRRETAIAVPPAANAPATRNAVCQLACSTSVPASAEPTAMPPTNAVTGQV